MRSQAFLISSALQMLRKPCPGPCVSKKLFEVSGEIGERAGLMEVEELVPCAALAVTFYVPMVELVRQWSAKAKR